MDTGSRLLQSVIPVFLLFIVVEMIVDQRRHTGRYRRSAAWADLATGTVSQVFDLVLKAACLPLYVVLYEHARLFQLDGRPWLHWLVALLGVDLLYYFWHRAGHEVRVLWAVHAVHHQSEDMNLAVALRQPAFQAPSVVLFFLPLAVLGVSPTLVMVAYTINLIYQFFVHTEAVRSLGPLEWLLNTPSHHRVHHGMNPEYLDKNYGGVLIVWDRLFGTFEREQAAPRYGVTTQLTSFNPLWANLTELAALVRHSRHARGAGQLARLWLGHPASTLPGSPTVAAALSTGKYDVTQRGETPYIYWQAALLFLGLNTAFLWVAHATPHSALATAWAAFAVLWSAVTLLGSLERRHWSRGWELARIPFVALGAGVSGLLMSGVAAGIALLLAAALILTLPLLALPGSPLRALPTHDLVQIDGKPEPKIERSKQL